MRGQRTNFLTLANSRGDGRIKRKEKSQAFPVRIFFSHFRLCLSWNFKRLFDIAIAGTIPFHLSNFSLIVFEFWPTRLVVEQSAKAKVNSRSQLSEEKSVHGSFLIYQLSLSLADFVGEFEIRLDLMSKRDENSDFAAGEENYFISQLKASENEKSFMLCNNFSIFFALSSESRRYL